MRKRNKSITSLDYVPSPNDLRMTDQEHYEMAMNEPYKLNSIIESWIENNNLKIAERKKEESRRLSLVAKSHWYNMESKEDIKQAIEKTRVLADEYLDKTIKQQKNERLYMYFADLQYRVKKGMFTLTKVHPNKLKRFPKYDPSTKEIFGSRTSIIKLWIHVFSLRK